jgi:cytochrome c-type biogenesis protein CcmH
MMYLWFILMLVISALWLSWFLYRPLKTSAFNLEKSNIALGRQKQTELEQDLQNNLIDEQVFEQAKDEIVQTLSVEIEQTHGTTATDDTQQSVSIGLIMLIVAFLFGASLLVYQSLTSYTTVTEVRVQSEKVPTLAQSIARIKQRVEEKPDDVKAWRMLGLALFESGEVKPSLKAYERAAVVYEVSDW